MRSSHKRRRIAEAHLAATARGWRLIGATADDFEQALGVERMLDERASSRGGELVSLPRPYDYSCSPLDVDESAGEAELARIVQAAPVEPLPPLTGWMLALALGVGAWLIIIGLAFGLYWLLEAVAP